LEISIEMLNSEALNQLLQFEDRRIQIARYMEYPTKNCTRRFVLQNHWRGASVHKDLRMEMNGHLVGWTILDNYKGTPDVATLEDAKRVYEQNKNKFQFRPDNKGIGRRAEPKCRSETCDEWTYKIDQYDEDKKVIEVVPRYQDDLTNLEDLAAQPKVWLKVEGVVKPGGPGATRNKPGVFHVIDKGIFYEGAQKPFFHEYFLKGTKLFKDWTRIVIRSIGVPVLDPETKEPKRAKEIMWRALVTKDQIPYAISKRARSKDWIPPKGIIPIPPTWRKGEQYNQWYSWVQDKWKEKPKGTEKGSKLVRWSLALISWRGQKVIRGMPRLRFYLRIDTGMAKVRSWQVNGNPTIFAPLSARYEGEISKKWLTYEGELQPMTEYNPNKKLKAKVKMLDKGTAKIESITNEKIKGEHLVIHFKGSRLKGKWLLKQGEKGSTFYSLDILSNLELSDIKGGYVYHRHYWDNKEHWVLRMKVSKDSLQELVLYKDIRYIEVEEPVRVIRKYCDDPEKWFITKGTKVEKKIGGLQTYIDVLEVGKFRIIENTAEFMSMFLKGKDINGYYIAKKEETWVFMKSKLPHPMRSLLLGDLA